MRTYVIVSTETRVHKRLYPLKSTYMYGDTVRTLTYIRHYSCDFFPFAVASILHMCGLPHLSRVISLPRTKNRRSITLGQICQSCKNSLAEITKLLGTSENSLMPTPLCHNVTMRLSQSLLSFYRSLMGV